ncbi:MAG: SDR family oxidoreductase [Candidatus Dadabacteria bacterium]|nr:MAG: SDR family oxidoreductase [Candidatus Dadabacteria bacterium]
MTSFSGKTAWISGGASGIGRALAEQLVDRGATVRIVDIASPNKSDLPRGCAFEQVDVRDGDAVDRSIRSFAEAHGRIDYVFNNAGVVVIGLAEHADADDWQRVIDVNINGVVHGVRTAYELMRVQRSGHIVNTASVAGLIATPGAVAYSASKHAVVGLSRALRPEAARHNVRVSVVCPGFVRTPMADNGKMIGGIERGEALDQVGRLTGWLTPRQMATATLRGVARNRPVIVAPRPYRGLARTLALNDTVTERFGRWATARIAALGGR